MLGRATATMDPSRGAMNAPMDVSARSCQRRRWASSGVMRLTRLTRPRSPARRGGRESARRCWRAPRPGRPRKIVARHETVCLCIGQRFERSLGPSATPQLDLGSEQPHRFPRELDLACERLVWELTVQGPNDLPETLVVFVGHIVEEKGRSRRSGEGLGVRHALIVPEGPTANGTSRAAVLFREPSPTGAPRSMRPRTWEPAAALR